MFDLHTVHLKCFCSFMCPLNVFQTNIKNFNRKIFPGTCWKNGKVQTAKKSLKYFCSSASIIISMFDLHTVHLKCFCSFMCPLNVFKHTSKTLTENFSLEYAEKMAKSNSQKCIKIFFFSSASIIISMFDLHTVHLKCFCSFMCPLNVFRTYINNFNRKLFPGGQHTSHGSTAYWDEMCPWSLQCGCPQTIIVAWFPYHVTWVTQGQRSICRKIVVYVVFSSIWL